MKKIFLFFCFSVFIVSGYTQPYPKVENTVRVMSYNIRNAIGMDSNVDYQRIANVINGIAPDLVALQEVDSVTLRSKGVDVLARLASLTAMYPVYGASIPLTGGKYGIGILSKEKSISWKRIPLPGREELRSLLIVEFKNYIMACTHFSQNSEDRLTSVSIINEVVKTYNKPVILAGDINIIPQSPELNAFREKWIILSNITEYTFPANNPTGTLDYILGYKPTDYTYSIWQRSILNEPVASDHLPLFADVRISTTDANIWMPIVEVIEKVGNTKDGTLTNTKVDDGGIMFVSESKDNPNYAIFTEKDNAPNLKLVFEGVDLIGAGGMYPVWYYRIMLDDKYLTHTTSTYPYNGNNYELAVFQKTKIVAESSYAKDNVYADKNFVQTFGFRYINDKSNPDRIFMIVSHADYNNKPTKEDEYYYLSEVNNHFVFVKSKDEALKFQWGKANNGTDINMQIVGKGSIYGITGGIKLLNTTGKVDIYSIDGRLISSTIVNSAETTISAPRGIIIVKNGANVVKVVVQ